MGQLNRSQALTKNKIPCKKTEVSHIYEIGSFEKKTNNYCSSPRDFIFCLLFIFSILAVMVLQA